MAVSRYYTSTAQPTTLSGNISSGATTMPVIATTGFPPSTPYTLAVDYGQAAEELVEVSNAAGTSLTVTRGVDGTSAQSHGIGAVVRHVTSARDFADSRTHEAATAAVHGVAGTLVGTSDIQTLANKTLTAPTVNAGALSGTFTGAPTFSGALTFSGNPVLSGNPSFMGVPAFSTTAGVLSQRAAAANAAWRASVAGDINDRYTVGADGKINWGPGNAVADTVLYRNAAGELKTDTALTVGGNLAAANVATGAAQTWAVTWSTTTGAHTPAIGNGTITAQYMKTGRLATFWLAMTFGSSTNFGAGVTTGDNWGFTIPGGFTASPFFTGTQAICGFGRATQAAGATIPVTVRVDPTGVLVLDTSGGRQDGVSITNTGAVDSLTPWTWASGNVVQFWGQVETTA